MDVITILRDETHNRKLIQIDLQEFGKDEELIEDLFDIIISEIRKMMSFYYGKMQKRNYYKAKSGCILFKSGNKL